MTPKKAKGGEHIEFFTTSLKLLLVVSLSEMFTVQGWTGNGCWEASALTTYPHGFSLNGGCSVPPPSRLGETVLCSPFGGY